MQADITAQLHLCPSLHGGYEQPHSCAKCLRINMSHRQALGNGLLITGDRHTPWLSLSFHVWVENYTLLEQSKWLWHGLPFATDKAEHK